MSKAGFQTLISRGAIPTFPVIGSPDSFNIKEPFSGLITVPVTTLNSSGLRSSTIMSSPVSGYIIDSCFGSYYKKLNSELLTNYSKL
ncbi:ATV_HP_G0159000.mRNA.1.CDS.1 [Saccharomyces cerevisiae]|nr:ATV_HP_G0159000.mRNA.1.CDS.1 [Saccharomyces cerevisiae]CAI6938334.1 ATV_HP_G0159000.mRNA.1.CDS.1 [Saccharomyces cerevisiae]